MRVTGWVLAALALGMTLPAPAAAPSKAAPAKAAPARGAAARAAANAAAAPAQADAPGVPAGFEGAKWVWSPLSDPAGGPMDFLAGSVYFRAAFDLPAGATARAAQAILTVDNLFILYVNGQPVGESDADNSAWGKPRRYDVAPLLVPGKNVIAVEGVNTLPGAAGLIFRMSVDVGAAKPIEIASDISWKCTERAGAKWEQPAFDDKGWQAVQVLGDFGMAPWRTPAPRGPALKPAPLPGKVAVAAKAALEESNPGDSRGAITRPRGPAAFTIDPNPPADYRWPDAIAYVGDDCTLYRPLKNTGGPMDTLNVTIFNPRKSRGFPEHDLPAPMKMGRKLYTIRPAKPGVKPSVLIDAGKGALGSPSCSFDGKWIYVSMARDSEPFFHIYRVPATGGEPQKLTDGPFHDIDPAEMPDGRIIFTSTRIGTFEEYHSPPSRALFAVNPDGTKIRPVTNTIIFDNEPEVLADGRILFIRSDNFFDRGKVETMLHAVHPDGTEGYTEFALDNAPEYGNRLRAFVCGSPAPLPDGRVAFVSNPGITIGWPGMDPRSWQHLRIEAGDTAALPDGRLLCTLPRRVELDMVVGKQKRKAADLSYEKIVLVNPDGRDGKLAQVLETPDAPLHSPIYVGPRPRPPVLPPRMDLSKAEDPGATGILFCQDARFSRNTTAGWPHVRAVRVLMGKGLTVRSSHAYIVHAGNETVDLGTVPLAPDGSFAVEVPADRPIAFQAVDAEGRSELNEMSWIYVRPGEKRGCVGCHQTRQAAPISLDSTQALKIKPLRLVGQGQPHRFRGNNPAVTGLMELQFDRFREVASLNKHSENPNPAATGRGDVGWLVDQLNGGDPGLRQSAAQRLALFRDPDSAAALAKRLHDKHPEVRVAAAMALASCGDRAAVPPLLDALEADHPLVAQAAAVALENLTAHAEPFDPFGPRERRGAQVAAWRAWFEKTSWEAIETELIARLDTQDKDKVRRAAVALGHIGAEPAKAALRQYVARERLVNPYPEWKQTHRSDGTRFNSVGNINPRTLQAATRALGYLKDAAAVPLLAETLAAHSDPEKSNLFLAEACAEALGRIGNPDADAALVQGMRGLKDYFYYVGWYGDHSALYACHGSPVHYFIAESLDRIGSTGAGAIVPHLIRSMPTDPDRALFPYTDDAEALAGRIIRRQGLEALVTETCLAILGDEQAKATLAAHQDHSVGQSEDSPQRRRDRREAGGGEKQSKAGEGKAPPQNSPSKPLLCALCASAVTPSPSAVNSAPSARDIEAAVATTYHAWGGKPDPENRAAHLLSAVCRDRAYEPRIRAAFERYQARPMNNNLKRVSDTALPAALPIRNWVCFFLARELGNLADPASTDALVAALDPKLAEAASGHPDPLGPGVLFLHNDLTPCWRAAAAYALGKIADRRAAPALLATIANLQNAPDTRHAAAESLGKIADPATLPELRKLAAEYPEWSTRRALNAAAERIATTQN